MNKRTRPAYSQMTERLETLIASGAYRGGDKLPPLRELSEEFQLTGYAVYEGLKHLSRKGVITLRHGSGAYVVEKRQNGTASDGWKIGVFVSTERVGAGYLSYSLFGLQEAAMRKDCVLTLRKRDYYQFRAPEPPLESLTHGFDGIVFLGEYDYKLLPTPLTVPAVGVEMDHTYDGIVSPLSLDPVTSAEIAVDFFRRRGKKKVKVFYFADAPLFPRRAECFRLAWEEFGRCELKPYGLVDELELSSDPSVGLLFCGGSFCERFLSSYRASTGKVLTDKVAVLSIDGKSLLMPGYQPVSTIAIDWRVAGEAAFDELLRRMEHPSAEARRVYLIPKLHELA
ncbi:MAG: GntR family transcriptional regulator [Victivallaceae bacterium]